MLEDQLMTALEVSSRLHVPTATLAYWRQCHTGPQWFKMGKRKVMYRQGDVASWLDSQYKATVGHIGLASRAA